MNQQLKNREQRLRYKAAKKGLYIKKGKWYEGFSQAYRVVHTGYSVGRWDIHLLIAGYDEWNQHLMTIEEAEAFVDEY